MKKPNLNKIFDLFEYNNDDQDLELVEEYKNSPSFKLDMFTNLVINGDNWKKTIVSIFKNSNAELDIGELNRVGDYMLYDKAWFWINGFDKTDKEWLSDLVKQDYDLLLLSLLRCKKYFETQEEYEKCAFLLEIENILRKA